MNRTRSVAAAALLAGVLVPFNGPAMVRSAAQRGQPVQIVSATGKCLDVHAPDQYTNGGRVQAWACNGTKQQDWYIERGALRSGVGKCLEVIAQDQHRNGARVQIWDCNGTIQQRWSVDQSLNQIKSGAGKCLDVHAAEQKKDGATVQVWDCNGSEQQRWSARPR